MKQLALLLGLSVIVHVPSETYVQRSEAELEGYVAYVGIVLEIQKLQDEIERKLKESGVPETEP